MISFLGGQKAARIAIFLPNYFNNQNLDSMSIDTQEFNDRVARWQSSEPGELAQNFHALQAGFTETGGPVNMQFVKGTSFPILNFGELIKRADQVTMIKIWMTLKEFDKTAIGFEPILEVFYLDETGTSGSFLLGSDAKNMTLGDTEPIPVPFVHNTTTLWADLESENLPGVFENRNALGQLQRVQFYVVEGIGLEMMKALFPTMTELTILPGLDLNKSVNAEDTIFIPIVKIKSSGIIPFGDHHIKGYNRVFRDGDDDDNYFDFNNPCPPFCGTPPPGLQ